MIQCALVWYGVAIMIIQMTCDTPVNHNPFANGMNIA